MADAAWEGFLGDTVTPRFPDGLTVLDGRGQWRGAEGLVQKERSKVLVILAPPGGDEMRLIDEVSDEYKGRFAQESVLRVVYDACVSFSCGGEASVAGTGATAHVWPDPRAPRYAPMRHRRYSG